MPNRPHSLCISLILDLLAGWLLMVLIVSNHSEIAFEKAGLVTPGMSPAEVRQILGKSDSLVGCVFVPVQMLRENNELKVDAIQIAPCPSMYSLCSGIDAHTLYARQEDEFYTYFREYSSEKCGVWLGKSYSIVVFFDQQRKVQKVFVLPTTLEKGDFKEWLEWQISRLLNK